MTLEAFEARLQDPDIRDYWMGVLLRQATPDDVFRFVSFEEIEEAWPRIERSLGQQRPFWTWWLDRRRRADASR